MIEVAVLDSGLTVGHPHVAGLRVRGFGLLGHEPPLERTEDFSDVTGHGTAVTAALHRLLPDASVLAVRLLDDELRTTTAALCDAIRLAADEGARVINLSLGSGRDESRGPLADAVAHAAERGAVCVAAAHPRGRTLFPADLPTVISVTTHRSCPLADLFAVEGPLPRFLAHGHPRPIEGRAPTDNFFGPSFAAVHVAARVARLLEDASERTFDDVVTGLREQCSGASLPA